MLCKLEAAVALQGSGFRDLEDAYAVSTEFRLSERDAGRRVEVEVIQLWFRGLACE